MSEWHVQVCRVTSVEKHPNADTLSTGLANGYPVIFRTGEYADGDLAVHVPIDSIVPDTEAWAFLAGHRRIKAKKLRGVFSMGLLTKALPEWVEGQEVAAELGIEKYDPDVAAETGGRGPSVPPADVEPGPNYVQRYDVEGYRKNTGLLQPGELVWISEKIHGQNARYVYDDGRLWAASKNWFKKRADEPEQDCTWWKVADRYGLEAKLATVPRVVIYGETYGNNADLNYGVNRAKEGDRFAMFDAFDANTGKWLDPHDMMDLAERLDIPVVPSVYGGLWDPNRALEFAEGPSLMPGANHIREGVVVKPIEGRDEPRFGRVFLKIVGQGYLLRKAA